MGNMPPCVGEDSCLGQGVGFNMLFWIGLASFVAPCTLGGYRRFCTAAGKKLAAKKKREKDARKDSRKASGRKVFLFVVVVVCVVVVLIPDQHMFLTAFCSCSCSCSCCLW